MTYEAIRVVIIILSILLTVRVLKVYIEVFIIFMFNQSNRQYDKRIEKPRLLFHIIAFIFIGLSFIPIYSLKGNINIQEIGVLGLLLASAILFSLGLVTASFSWSNKFSEKYIPVMEEKIKSRYQLKVKTGIDIQQYCEKLLDKKAIDEKSSNDLKLFLQGKDVKSFINWTDKTIRSKQVTYISLFNLLDEVVENGFVPKNEDRSIYINFVLRNFIIEGVKFETNIPARFSEWITSKNK